MHQSHSIIQRLAVYLRALAVILLVVVAGSANAQVAGTGTIQGTVTDSTGAVIPNATVTLENASTNTKSAIKTDASGIYVFPNIVVGTYTVRVTAPGFEAYNKTGN